MPDTIRPTDDAARQIARDVLADARSAALAAIRPDGAPLATRIAFGLGPDGAPVTLVSDLAAHTGALRANPVCSILVGDVEPRGDPLNQPRLTLDATAAFIPHHDHRYGEMAAHYLHGHPKAKLYVGFADFSFVRFHVARGFLNGGFGKAFTLTPADMGLPG